MLYQDEEKEVEVAPETPATPETPEAPAETPAAE